MAAIDAQSGTGSGRVAAIVRALFARRKSREDARPDRVARAGLLVWAPIFLAFGIGAWFSLTFEPSVFVYGIVGGIAVAALIAAWIVRRRAMIGALDWDRADALRIALIVVALVATGFLCIGYRAHQVAAPVLDFRYYGPIEGRVVNIDRSARDRMRVTLDQVVLRNTDPARTPHRVRLSLTEPQALPTAGTRVMLTGHLGPNPGPAEPNGFDFRRGAYFMGLGAVGYTRTPIVTVEPAPPNRWDATALRLKLGAAMRDGIGGQEGAVAAALMTGDRSGIAEATNEVMRDSNLYHIVSISGLHMSMLAGFVYAALRMVFAALQATAAGQRHAAFPVHKAAAVGALIASAAYMWLSDGGVATERAFLMVAVMLGAILIDRRAISLRTVAVAAIVILLVAPEALVTPGFQMSFAATAALIMVFPAWSRFADPLPWIIRGAALLVISSVIAGIATSPIAAVHFQRSAQYGLIANLLVVPVMGAIVMPAGVIAAILAPLGLAAPALWLMGLGTRWMLYVGEVVAGWGGSVIAVPAPHWSVLALGGAGGTIALMALHAPVRRRAALFVAGLGGCAVAVAAMIWVSVARPFWLVSPDGAAVGALTEAGRALSKPAGAFVANSWLQGDGDIAEADASAERPLWSGERGARIAEIGTQRVVHLSGKGAGDRAAEHCAGGAIVVVQGEVERELTGDCTLLDEARLRESGAQAAWLSGSRVKWLTAAEASGERLWTSQETRRLWKIGIRD